MKYTIYLVKSPSNKYYIGITSRSLKIRKRQHIMESQNGSSLKFHAAVYKYGDKLMWSEIAHVYSKDDAFLIEEFFIQKYDSYSKGYNSTKGGEGRNVSSKYTEEDILSISKRYRTKSEWKKKDSPSYQFALADKTLYVKCSSHMDNDYLEYSDEQIILDAKKYKTLREWRTNSKNIYQVAHRRGDLFDKCKSFMISEKHHWLDSELLILSKQYNSKKEWEMASPASNRAARRRPDLYKICTIHMKPKSKIKE